MASNFINPASTVDLIVENEFKEILLVKRKNSPFKNFWALPGGFLDCGKETLEYAVKRELEEETSLKTEKKYLELFGNYSCPNRDPRGHVISHVYLVGKYFGSPRANDDAKELDWFRGEYLPQLAFDHEKILGDYLEWRQSK